MSRHEKVSESHRLEIEVATVLLGFVFVIDSIILTMPSDVLDLINHEYIIGFFGLKAIKALDLYSMTGFYCTLLLLTAIPAYFLYFKIRRKWALLIARSLFAVGIYFVVILVLLVNNTFMDRLVGNQANIYMNPVSGVILFL